MTVSRLIRRSAVAAAAIFITLVPLAAQSSGHRRASVPPTGVTVTLTGIISDATNGQPLANGQVTAGGRFSAFTTSDGKYTIQIPKNINTAVTASQFAFNSSTVPVFGREGATANFSLTPKPVVTVKLTAPQGPSGQQKDTFILDVDTAQFAYLIPFSGYVRSDNGNFCKDDGTSITPSKKDIKRVVGPATSVNVGACCTLGPMMKAQLEMKSGETLTVYFNDSCYGNEVDFLGREKSSGVYQYFRFTDIAEVDFP